MYRIVVMLLSVLVALGITLGASVALADEEGQEHEGGKYEVTFSSSPRFPVVGEEAELTFEVFHDGTHEEGLMVMVVLARAEADDHHDEAVADDPHDEAVADDPHDEAVADDPHDEAVADDHHNEAENVAVESMEITAMETAPGVYVAHYTFEQDGKYQVTAYLGEEHTEFVVAVRASPVAWSFIIGLAGVSVLLAGVVAVIKTIRKEW